jgi:UDP-N-acetylmuramoyl-tripeptide--D-alanyl-D-alanine ligase
MNFSSKQIAEATGGTVIRGDAVGPVLTDTREISKGAWFLAIVGERFDAHLFLTAAVAEGALGLIVDRVVDVPDDVAIVQVSDTTRAFQSLGNAARKRLTGPLVALTGSSGKTTTRALISLALSPMGEVYQTKGNLNNHFGVPMTLVKAPENAPVSVVELGTSSPGEISLLEKIASPDVRLIVNVGPAHLLELGGLEGVAKEKGALFAGAQKNDALIVNIDDDLVSRIPRPMGARVITYGRHLDATVRVMSVDVRMAAFSTAVTYVVEGEEHCVTIPAPGEHIAHNGAAAVAVAYALGVDVAGAVSALAQYEPVGMRLAMSTLQNGVRVINDAYNANPDSVRASLRLLSAADGRTIAVLGDMLELGVDEQIWHDRVAEYAGEVDLDLVVFVGERMSRAAQHCNGAAATIVSAVRDGVAQQLDAWLQEGDTVLFKGSRGSRIESILEELKEILCSTHS